MMARSGPRSGPAAGRELFGYLYYFRGPGHQNVNLHLGDFTRTGSIPSSFRPQRSGGAFSPGARVVTEIQEPNGSIGAPLLARRYRRPWYRPRTRPQGRRRVRPCAQGRPLAERTRRIALEREALADVPPDSGLAEAQNSCAPGKARGVQATGGPKPGPATKTYATYSRTMSVSTRAGYRVRMRPRKSVRSRLGERTENGNGHGKFYRKARGSWREDHPRSGRDV